MANHPADITASIIGWSIANADGKLFHAINPASGQALDTKFSSATEGDVDRAANLAAEAFLSYSVLPGKARAEFLRLVASSLSEAEAAIVDRAHLETGLPLPRLQGELARTTGQLRLFGDVLDEGSWVNARIDTANPDRKPIPRPDLRSMLKPLGPVAVFGASNFPLAFSVAGGDTASALAAGNPVIVKAHPAHPGTSALVGRIIQASAQAAEIPEGVFSLLFDAGIEVGSALVQHPAIKAVAFTGSSAGGQALMRLAADRPEPIPCFAEMGSVNPMFVLPGAMQQRAAQIAQGLQTSFTLGAGQFCTKPGLVFIPQADSEPFVRALQQGVSALPHQQMLTPSIAARFQQAMQERIQQQHAELLACGASSGADTGASAAASVFTISIDDFFTRPQLSEETFGPATLLITYNSVAELVEAARRMHGHLTATVHGAEQDLSQASPLLRALETRVGRLLFNGYPTGVEVSHAMVHGGPFPATSDGRSTSVGSMAMFRFTRPVCYQDVPDAFLPPELQSTNPLGILRLLNGSHSRD